MPSSTRSVAPSVRLRRGAAPSGSDSARISETDLVRKSRIATLVGAPATARVKAA